MATVTASTVTTTTTSALLTLLVLLHYYYHSSYYSPATIANYHLITNALEYLLSQAEPQPLPLAFGRLVLSDSYKAGTIMTSTVGMKKRAQGRRAHGNRDSESPGLRRNALKLSADRARLS